MSASPRQSLQELYQACHGELEAVLLARVLCRETAADLCQEAFARLCRIDNLAAIGNLKAYLYRIALNLVCDHYRSGAAHAGIAAEWPDDAAPEAEDWRCAQTVALGEEELAGIINALAGLPPLCQRIFYLNRFEGLKHRDIAAQLRISVRTVENNINRALRHCARTLADLDD